MHGGFDPKNVEGAFGALLEELGEAVAAGGKLHRFGPFSSNPLLPPEQREANIDALMRELGDVETRLAHFRQALGQPDHLKPPRWGRADHPVKGLYPPGGPFAEDKGASS